MNDDFLLKFKAAAQKNLKNRKDPRFRKVLGFLVAKGFLHTNFEVCLLPNQRIAIEDAIWAGKNVEPRILEVLPAAVYRLNKHFDYDPKVHRELAKAIEAGLQGTEGAFYEIPARKLKPWFDLKLKDGRTKKVQDLKVTKTFRFHANNIAKLKLIKEKTGKTETQILEELIETWQGESSFTKIR